MSSEGLREVLMNEGVSTTRIPIKNQERVSLITLALLTNNTLELGQP